MKSFIPKEHRRKSGVYKILNIVTNKFYIGSTFDLHGRFLVHKSGLNRGGHPNPHLQSSFQKYGKDAFHFIVVELCDIDDLLLREQFYLDTTRCFDSAIGYNIRSQAESNFGIKLNEERKLSIQKHQITIRGRDFHVISPEGQEYRGRGTRKFAKEHNLTESIFMKMVSGGASHCQGWHLFGIAPPEKRKKEQPKIYKFIDKNNILHEVKRGELKNFSRRYNLWPGGFSAIWYEQRKSYKGWRKAQQENVITCK